MILGVHPYPIFGKTITLRKGSMRAKKSRRLSADLAGSLEKDGGQDHHNPQVTLSSQVHVLTSHTDLS